MSLSLSCPGCGARLRAPDAALGRTLQCPKCKGPVVVPAVAPPAEFAFTAAPVGGDDDDGDGNPFEDEGPAEESQAIDHDAAPRKKTRKTAAKKKPAGFNPFDDGRSEPATEAQPAKKRKYRKDGDYNPFGDAEGDEEPDPASEAFDFGVEAPPSSPAGEFDFGPLDPRRDDRR